MLTCPRCGQVNASGAQVCMHCGLPLAAGVPAPSASTPPPAAVSATSSGIPFQAPLPLSDRPNVPPPPTPSGVEATGTRRGNKRQVPQPSDLPPLQCRLCGAPVYGYAACHLCGAPPGLIANPNDATGATYISIGMRYPFGVDAIEARPVLPLPPALAGLRWNWGAFGASLPWLVAHRIVGWTVIVLLLDVLSPLVYFGTLYLLIPLSGALFSVALGMQGHSLAWQGCRDGDQAAFLRRETRWKWIGAVGIVFKSALLAALTLIAFSQH